MKTEEKLKVNELGWGLLSDYRRELMGIAAIFVVLHHVTNGRSLPDGFMNVYNVFSRLRGVDIFMILSGVGLYYSFSASPKIGQFYKKRYIRLLIPYLLIVVPFYYYSDKLVHASNFNYYFWTDVTQISFYTRGMTSTWFVPTIAVFYLFFPLVYWLQNKVAKDGKLFNREVCTLLMCALLCAFILTVKELHPGKYKNVEIGLSKTIPFVFGCWLGKWVKERKKFGFTTLVTAAVFIPVYMFAYKPAVSLDNFWARTAYSFAGFALCIVFAWLLNLKKEGTLPWIHKVLRFLGDRSLEMYLIHLEVNWVWNHNVEGHLLDQYGFVDYVIVIAISVVLSMIFHYIIEKIANWILKKPKPAAAK